MANTTSDEMRASSPSENISFFNVNSADVEDIMKMLPTLPPVNYDGYSVPAIPQDQVTMNQCNLPNEEQVINVEYKDDDTKTVIINKNNYKQYNKTINIIVCPKQINH